MSDVKMSHLWPSWKIESCGLEMPTPEERAAAIRKFLCDEGLNLLYVLKDREDTYP